MCFYICIFNLTFYDEFLTVAMQKYREGCTFSSKISASRRRNPTLAQASPIPRIPRIPRKRCQRPRLATSPTRAGGQDDVSLCGNGDIKPATGGATSRLASPACRKYDEPACPYIEIYGKIRQNHIFQNFDMFGRGFAKHIIFV